MAESVPPAQPVQQQSWTAWLLDAYANSIAPSPSEENFPEDQSEGFSEDSRSPTFSDSSMSSMSPTSSSSLPYGPYVRTGRGGAGNFQWQSQQNTPTDVEAQKPTLSQRRKMAANIEHLDTGDAMRRSLVRKSSLQYVRMGRGGAGNTPLMQSNEPQQSPRAVSFPLRSPTASPVMYSGRGGAGNYAATSTSSEQAQAARLEQEQIEAEKRRQKAEQEVGSLLQPPSQAWLGGRGKSTDVLEEVELEDWK